MKQVQLSDHLYQRASQQAEAAGFSCVDDFVADIIASELDGSPREMSILFPPEILADLDRVEAEVQSGKRTYSQQDVDEHLQRKSQAWRATHGS